VILTHTCRGKKEAEAVQRAAGGVTVTCPSADDEQDDDDDNDQLLYAANDDAVSDAGTVTSTATATTGKAAAAVGRRGRISEYNAMDTAVDGSDSPTSVTSESFAEESDVSRRVTRGSVSTCSSNFWQFLGHTLLLASLLVLLLMRATVLAVLIVHCKDRSRAPHSSV
jgi:hypothetical protein